MFKFTQKSIQFKQLFKFSSDQANVIVNIENKIAYLTLNKLKTRNALSLDFMHQISQNITELIENKNTSVIVIQSSGPVFSSGHDLKELRQIQNILDETQKKQQLQEIFDVCGQLMIKIETSPKPIIAKVNGFATAAGCQLVASCDLAYASQKSKFATPGVNIGLFCTTPMVALKRCIGKKAAYEMLYTGEPISAQKAESIGLINKQVDENELDKEVQQIASYIVQKSKYVIQLGKQATLNNENKDLLTQYDMACKTMTENMCHDDAQEGISAFLEKRHPHWN